MTWTGFAVAQERAWRYIELIHRRFMAGLYLGHIPPMLTSNSVPHSLGPRRQGLSSDLHARQIGQ